MAKFKIADWAYVKGAKLEGMGGFLTKVHILEVVTQLCEAGIEQTRYLCRIFIKSLRCGWEPAAKEIQFREMELESIEKETNE